jgi:putative endonuclease
MTNKKDGVLYVGITNDLIRRVIEHREGRGSYFTKKYGTTILVYYEIFQEVGKAIQREKQIKAGSRKKKIVLIEGFNPTWKDMYFELL